MSILVTSTTGFIDCAVALQLPAGGDDAAGIDNLNNYRDNGHPISLHAATKKTNELMAHASGNLFRPPTSGPRFSPIELRRFIELIEQDGRTGTKQLLPMQPGDVPDTCAKVDNPMSDGYVPSISSGVGIEKFATWYRMY